MSFLLIGVNPRRPYDEGYRSFVNMLNRQLATSLASIILFEDEIRRGQTAAEAAAKEKEQLSEQLAAQTLRMVRLDGGISCDPLADRIILKYSSAWLRPVLLECTI